MNKVEAYRTAEGLTFEALGEKLGCSKGHAADLCSGRRNVTQRIAYRLEALTKKPWHEWMPKPERADGEAA